MTPDDSQGGSRVHHILLCAALILCLWLLGAGRLALEELLLLVKGKVTQP